MKEKGPILETLTRRLAECPPEFLAEPRVGQTGIVHVTAVVSDLMEELGGPSLTLAMANRFDVPPTSDGRNRLRIVLVGCWLLHDPWFRDRGYAAHALGFLAVDLANLSGAVQAEKLVTDPD